MVRAIEGSRRAAAALRVATSHRARRRTGCGSGPTFAATARRLLSLPAMDPRQALSRLRKAEVELLRAVERYREAKREHQIATAVAVLLLEGATSRD